MEVGNLLPELFNQIALGDGNERRTSNRICKEEQR